MPTIHFILKDGSDQAVAIKVGSNVMEAAIRANVRGIDAECGGSCVCATCHVYVADEFIGALPGPDADEAEMLGFVVAGRLAGSRLSCQIRMTAELDGLVLRVPESQ